MPTHPVVATFDFDQHEYVVRGPHAYLMAERIGLHLMGPAAPQRFLRGEVKTRPTHADGRPALRLLPTEEDEDVAQRERLDRAWRVILRCPEESLDRHREALEALGYEFKAPITLHDPWLVFHKGGWSTSAHTSVDVVRKAQQREFSLWDKIVDLQGPELKFSMVDEDYHAAITPGRQLGPDLATGLLDMIEREVLTEANLPEDWQWLVEQIGPDRVEKALELLREPDPFDRLARAAMALVELVDECDFTDQVKECRTPAEAFGLHRHSFVRLARGLETAVKDYREAQVDG